MTQSGNYNPQFAGTGAAGLRSADGGAVDGHPVDGPDLAAAGDAYALQNDPQFAKYKTILRHTAYAAAAYLFWGVLDVYGSANITGNTAPHFDAALFTMMIGVPALLHYFRQGVMSGLALAGLTVLNMIALVGLYKAGMPGVASVSWIAHLPFTALFLRGAWSARKLRQFQKAKS